MATWSSRRKSRIAISILIIILALGIAGYRLFLYKPPTCFDGIKNGSELDVDCGGRCEKLCQSAFVPAKIAWGGGKYELLAPSLYNVAALIINPNTNAAAKNVPYKFTLYDNQGLLIADKTGTIDIPAHRNVVAFDTAVDVGQRKPSKVTFEFINPPTWFKSHDTLESLAIIDKKYSEDEKSSSLEVVIENKGLTTVRNLTVGALLFDINENVIGFSRTKIDRIDPGKREIAPFTWPFTRGGKVTTIEAFPVSDPVQD